MKSNERVVSFYDLRIESHFRAGDPIPGGVIRTSEALALARKSLGSGKHVRGNGRVQTALQEWLTDPKRREHYLLFNRADATLRDIPLRDLGTGAIRMAGKRHSEGIDLSAHVFIRENADPKKPALLLMTAGSSLQITKVTQCLTTLFKQAGHDPANEGYFERPDPSGATGATRRLYSSFRADGHQNARLTTILNGGGLQGLDLISEADRKLDEENSLLITATEFKVAFQRTDRRLSLASLRRAVGMAPEKINSARIRFKLPGETKVHSHTFGVDELDSAFVKRDVIRFIDPLPDRFDKVSTLVVEKLRELADRA